LVALYATDVNVIVRFLVAGRLLQRFSTKYYVTRVKFNHCQCR